MLFKAKKGSQTQVQTERPDTRSSRLITKEGFGNGGFLGPWVEGLSNKQEKAPFKKTRARELVKVNGVETNKPTHEQSKTTSVPCVPV